MTQNPLWTLTDYNITSKRWLVLRLEAAGQTYRRKIDLNREGAGLWCVMYREGIAVFRRQSRLEQHGGTDWELSAGRITAYVSPHMCRCLRHDLWHTAWNDTAVENAAD